MYRTTAYGVSALLLAGVVVPAVLAPQIKESPRHGSSLASVSGRVTLLDNQNDISNDVGQAVLWLAATGGVAARPDTVEIMMSDREFRPHVSVVSTGSTLSFPNMDPFNHNVFSLSDVRPFDLGDYERGTARSIVLRRPGVMLVLCNVHAQMSAIVVVRDNPYYTQPAADGSFRMVGVPPGDYVLHVWHERTKEFTRPLHVGSDVIDDLEIQLDARTHRFEQQLNDHGQPYSRVRRGRRY